MEAVNPSNQGCFLHVACLSYTFCFIGQGLFRCLVIPHLHLTFSSLYGYSYSYNHLRVLACASNFGYLEKDHHHFGESSFCHHHITYHLGHTISSTLVSDHYYNATTSDGHHSCCNGHCAAFGDRSCPRLSDHNSYLHDDCSNY